MALIVTHKPATVKVEGLSPVTSHVLISFSFMSILRHLDSHPIVSRRKQRLREVERLPHYSQLADGTDRDFGLGGLLALPLPPASICLPETRAAETPPRAQTPLFSPILSSVWSLSLPVSSCPGPPQFDSG